MKKALTKLVNKITKITSAAAIVSGVFFMTQVSAAESNASADKNPPAKAGTAAATSSRAIQVFGQVHKHSLGVGLGQTVLMGDMADLGENSITVDAYYNYSASHSFDLMINAHISQHESRTHKLLISGVATSIKAKLFQFDQFSPYVFGGLGFYVPNLERIGGNKDDYQTKIVFGTNLGAGADLKLNDKISFGIIGHYHNPFDIGQDLLANLEGSYFKFLLTTLYSF